ncbi:protein FERTILITY RESTORER RF2, mitochondrial-like [Oryza brachyantha]|uniref:Uncharacterized protein n=1 Tax=Oryza brachyantha TaxID=4533 RepID=J3MDQ7_ORYBR|nr:protein FERTILITY RESTORER RF2, mitochondrial-like [Oryza brachyantha]XP_015694396.1 protein FERTILITY RESTORER RF2, mitochondrial-like [Oryza brachyantha]
MSAITMQFPLPQPVVASAAIVLSTEKCNKLAMPCPQILRNKVNSLSFSGKVSTKPTMHSFRCHATQTQSAQRKSATATIQRSEPKGKLKGPKLDDGSGGFPPFRFGKGGGGGGGGGGGSNYLGGFLLFTCVLLMDYLKEFEKNLLLQRHRMGDEATVAGLS